jgi:transcriptional regulator with XRE-family HTH domain
MVSSNILTKLVPVVAKENITLDVVGMNQGKVFADYVRKAIKEKGLKLREIEARSGGRITHGYISKIISNSFGSLTTERLCGLAQGMGANPLYLFCLATGAEPEHGSSPEQLAMSTFFGGLPADKQKVALILVERLYDEYALKPAEVQAPAKKKRRSA